MEFTKKEALIKQILLYLNTREFKKAFSLSQELAYKFPEDLLSHYLLAKSAYWAEDYHEAEEHARKAFNLAHGNDLLHSAILLGCVLFMKKDFSKGYQFLETIEESKMHPASEDLQELLTVYSLALNNPKAAVMHVNRLYDLNSPHAQEFILGHMYPKEAFLKAPSKQ